MGQQGLMRKLINIVEGDHTPPQNDPDDAEHYTALKATGFFGSQGAGCIPMSKKTGRVLLVLRSQEVEQPHTWGNPGGAHKADERPVDAARRELVEETGYSGPAAMVPLLVFQSGTFRYCNFLALVEDEFLPDLGWEATDHVWVNLGGWPTPLHFGVASVFNDEASVKVLQHYAQLFGGK
jgi:8-oxo-dGTP pyrophosphatase MutT (NUDIX family)